MRTIIDYIKENKDTSFIEMPWNNMDNLLCAILTYIPLSGFKENKKFYDICDEVDKCKLSKDSFYMEVKAKEFCSFLKNSKRYENLILCNFEKEFSNSTQYGALTFLINDKKIIAFEGSDYSIISWIENFRIMYDYPTFTQKLAIKYLKKNIKFKDKEVYVLGHSKGGNLAMISSMKLNSFKYKRVKKIINFDGPGLRKEEFLSKRYQRIYEKLTNIIPSKSYVGSLLYNKNYEVVKSSSVLLREHFPDTWLIKTNIFEETNLSKLSIELNKKTTSILDTFDKNRLGLIFEEAFKNFPNKARTITINDIEDLVKVFKSMDSDDANYIANLIISMFELSRK